jgi:hypothetical protein
LQTASVPFRNNRNWLTGKLNREAPQLKQVNTFGNARTPGSSRAARSLWIIISTVNSARFVEEHKSQGIGPPSLDNAPYSIAELSVVDTRFPLGYNAADIHGPVRLSSFVIRNAVKKHGKL